MTLARTRLEPTMTDFTAELIATAVRWRAQLGVLRGVRCVPAVRRRGMLHAGSRITVSS